MQKVSIRRVVDETGNRMYIDDSRTGERLRQYELFDILLRSPAQIETEIRRLSAISEPSELHESNLWC